MSTPIQNNNKNHIKNRLHYIPKTNNNNRTNKYKFIRFIIFT